MSKLDEIKNLKVLAEELQLENCEILRKYTDDELAAIYNGIGSDAMPDWLRNAISALHPSLAVVAFIHDVEWHESDRTKESFTESNERFKRNGYKVAKSQFGWYNPRRYIIMNQARRFGNICQMFGWNGWATPCECEVCKNKTNGGSVKKLCFIGTAILAVWLLASCSHNVIQYGDGIGFDAGINPENYTASFNLRYGKILSAVTRDNVEIEMTGKAEGSGGANENKSARASTDGTLKVKVGRQINGYAVDLVKAGADAGKVVETLKK